MRMLLLAEEGLEAAPQNNEIIACWEGEGHVSIARETRKRLKQIRAEHMRWAYEAGARKKGAGPSLAEKLECGAPLSMWWTSILYERHPKLSPELYPIYKARCLEMLLDENRVDALEIRGGDKFLKKTLKSLCAAKGVKFSASAPQKRDRKRSPAGESLLQRVYKLFPAPARALIRFCHWLLTVKRKLPGAGAPFNKTPAGAKEKDALIVSYFPNIDLLAAAKGRFRSRYWENLHNLLNEAAERENPGGSHFVNWLFIRSPSPDLSLDQCRQLCQTFAREGKDGASFYYLEQFLNFRGLCESFARWLKLCAASLAAQRSFAAGCRFQGSRLDFWPYVKWQWAESMRGWRCLERCLQYTAFKNYFKNSPSLRWTLFPLENCPWERMLTTASRAAQPGAPVYGTQHSIIRPTDFRYFDDPREFSDPACAGFQPDIFGANGLSGLSQWAENGMPPERERNLEALRYQYLAKIPRIENEEPSTLPPQPGEPLEAPGRRLLVLTSFFKDETGAHLALLKETLEKGLLDNWRVIIKPHPYLAVESWLDSLAPRLQKRVEIVETPLSLALAEGGLVWTSNSTTAALEAAVKGLPLMVMSPAGDFDLCPIQNIPNLARTASIEDVEKGLAAPPFPDLPKNYLNLAQGLEEWKKLLKLA